MDGALIYFPALQPHQPGATRQLPARMMEKVKSPREALETGGDVDGTSESLFFTCAKSIVPVYEVLRPPWKRRYRCIFPPMRQQMIIVLEGNETDSLPTTALLWKRFHVRAIALSRKIMIAHCTASFITTQTLVPSTYSPTQ